MKQKNFTTVLLMVTLLLSFGCGSGGGSSDFGSSPPADSENSTHNNSALTAEDIIAGPGYAGYLVLKFDESIGVRFVDGKLTTKNPSKISLVENVSLKLAHSESVVIEPTVKSSPEQIDKRRQDLERLSGKKLTDWNAWYHLKIENPQTAISVYQSLQHQQGVVLIYPATKPAPTSIDDVPDLTSWQGYLYSNESTGGLNAQAMWDAGVRGEGVTLVDEEGGWNFDHEDLPLSDIPPGGACTPEDIDNPFCTSLIPHGTAMVGIMAALDNDHGVAGLAPDAVVMVAGERGLGRFVDGDEMDGEIAPGSVYAIIYGGPGALSPDGFCASDPYGCIAEEANAEVFAIIEQATAVGVTVVSAAGNGSVSLNEEATYHPWQVNLGANDSGSIIVGGSNGPDHEKIPEANCGERVNLYGWGRNVATTAYPVGGYGWSGSTPPVPLNDDPNTFFANNIGGTSPATAMVAASAALLQSYAKREMGESETRYLMSNIVRQILVDSGVPQEDSECNIGKQPRLDVVMELVDDFLADINADYPELESGDRLTEDQMIDLRARGVGLICGTVDLETHTIVGANDSSCPELELWPAGNGIAKTLDFDGDGRADLVSASKTQWKLDLSTVGDGGDNFGSWDVTIDLPTIPGRWVWPYTEDMNSDGRTDIVMYDKENGKWHITYATTDLLESGDFPGWDEVMDYSDSWTDTLELDPWASHYSRPVPADYDTDGWIDIAIACSDGYWRIDRGGEDGWDGVWDWELRYLDDERLSEAPGWAYLPVAARYLDGSSPLIAFKVPDGLPEEGRLVIFRAASRFDGIPLPWAVEQPYVFGGNDHIALPGNFVGIDYGADIGLKTPDGSWSVAERDLEDLSEVSVMTVEPDGIYGGLGCHPAVGDFDGDGTDDRAVFCPDGWRIDFSDGLFPDDLDADGVRRVSLGYSGSSLTLPGRSYAGGISYDRVQRMIRFFQRMHPDDVPPSIPVDMVSLSACLATPSMSCE